MTDPILLAWLLGALIGSMLFFAATVAPTVFRALPAEPAGKFLRAFFPQYYSWGTIVALICTLGAILTTAGPLSIIGCGLVTLLFVYARQFLMPRINQARDSEIEGDSEAARRFKRLHLQSVVINAGQLLLLIVISSSLLWPQA